MTYPAVIVVCRWPSRALLVTYVLPKFRVFFASFNQELPLPTRMLLGLSGRRSPTGGGLILGVIALSWPSAASSWPGRTRGA